MTTSFQYHKCLLVDKNIQKSGGMGIEYNPKSFSQAFGKSKNKHVTNEK